MASSPAAVLHVARSSAAAGAAKASSATTSSTERRSTAWPRLNRVPHLRGERRLRALRIIRGNAVESIALARDRQGIVRSSPVNAIQSELYTLSGGPHYR